MLPKNACVLIEDDLEMHLSIKLALPASHFAVNLAEVLVPALLAFIALLFALLVGCPIFAFTSSIPSIPSISSIN